jgi:taurine--2-oxoglutarate transaminase
MAKGLSGAYAPLGATIVTGEIAEHFEENMLCHGHTYAGHSVACAAGLAAVETYQDDGLIEHADEVGSYLGERLSDLSDEHPSVGDVRGVGLFWGLEFTKDPDSRVPVGKRKDKISKGSTVVDEVSDAAADDGVYVANMINTLIIAPPLPITESEIDEAVEALDRALTVSDEAMIA